jgi:hypothetical protein
MKLNHPMDEFMTDLSVEQVGNSEKLHWIERIEMLAS